MTGNISTTRYLWTGVHTTSSKQCSSAPHSSAPSVPTSHSCVGVHRASYPVQFQIFTIQRPDSFCPPPSTRPPINSPSLNPVPPHTTNTLAAAKTKLPSQALKHHKPSHSPYSWPQGVFPPPPYPPVARPNHFLSWPYPPSPEDAKGPSRLAVVAVGSKG